MLWEKIHRILQPLCNLSLSRSLKSLSTLFWFIFGKSKKKHYVYRENVSPYFFSFSLYTLNISRCIFTHTYFINTQYQILDKCKEFVLIKGQLYDTCSASMCVHIFRLAVYEIFIVIIFIPLLMQMILMGTLRICRPLNVALFYITQNSWSLLFGRVK